MKQLTGIVVSAATPQTVTVSVERQWQHPLYKKMVRRSKKYACHVVDMELQVGDRVSIVPCKPVSKTKHFQVVAKVVL